MISLSSFFPDSLNPERAPFVHDWCLEMSKLISNFVHLYAFPQKPAYISWIRNNWKRKIPDLVSSDFPVKKFPWESFPKYSFKKRSINTLAKSLKRNINFANVNLIHTHDIFPCGLAAYKLRKLKDFKLITTLHGAALQDPTIKYEVKKRFFNQINDFTGFIAVSKKMERLMKENYNVKNIIRIENGFNKQMIDRFRNDFQNNISKKLKLISASRLVKSKGINITLEALSLLKQFDFEYHIFGKGYYSKKLENLIHKYNLENKVLLRGNINNQDLGKELLKSDIYILPSWIESFGISYVEGMYSGLAAIGVKGQGPSEYIIDGVNGFLAEPKSVKSVYDILYYLFTHTEKIEEIGDRAIQTAAQFSWENNVKKTIQFYKDIGVKL